MDRVYILTWKVEKSLQYFIQNICRAAMKYKEIQSKNVDLISVTQDMVEWLALMNAVITFDLHKVQSVSWLAV